ncbi:TetR family transcriptional regulator [Ruminococcaceae bacterium OttesenSCG-928-I18]|nr:TetR family transcriptional regulator [Ruminococcaceae bacterium OttesenSCG-928-I18]
MPQRIKTKELLADALKQLMADASIEQLGIQQICDVCGVHRKTFYYYFQNKYDLLNWIFYHECIEPLFRQKPESFEKAVESIVRKVDLDRAFYTNAFRIAPETCFGNTFSNSFQDYFIEQVKELLILYGLPHLPQPHLVEKETYETYYTDTLAGSLMGNVQQWLLEQPQLSVEQYLELLKTTSCFQKRKCTSEEERSAQKGLFFPFRRGGIALLGRQGLWYTFSET